MSRSCRSKIEFEEIPSPHSIPLNISALPSYARSKDSLTRIRSYTQSLTGSSSQRQSNRSLRLSDLNVPSWPPSSPIVCRHSNRRNHKHPDQNHYHGERHPWICHRVSSPRVVLANQDRHRFLGVKIARVVSVVVAQSLGRVWLFRGKLFAMSWKEISKNRSAPSSQISE